jgi:hypothetical protein
MPLLCLSPVPAARPWRGAILLPAVLATLLAAGCASYVPRAAPGQTVADVVAASGPPTGRYGMPDGGTRLEYARGPYGRHTYMVDTGPDGRVRGMEQVLTEARFAAIVPGMTIAEVQYALGRPSERRPRGWQPGEYWYWRYQATFCQWFVVTVAPGGRLTEAGYAPDPLCDHDDDDPH